MSQVERGLGPEIVLAGAARSGTSYLASRLSSHPRVDPPLVKEPNYFSRHLDRGPEWYDALFPSRGEGLRLDASMSYTFPHFPDALPKLAAAAPHALVVYVVREPVARMFSHYLLHRHYFGNEPATTLGAALDRNPVYLGASDYARWLGMIAGSFPESQRLVVPFEVLTRDLDAVTRVVLGRVGLEPVDLGAESTARAHRNNVVTFKSGLGRKARRVVKRSPAYPLVRRAVGPDGMRWLRNRMTRTVEHESLTEALEALSPAQRASVDSLADSAVAAATAALQEQDERLGLGWATRWVTARAA